MEQKDDLVTRLENNPNMDWRLRAWILHNHGYSNTGHSWHPSPGVPSWTPKPDKPSTGHRGRRKKTKRSS